MTYAFLSADTVAAYIAEHPELSACIVEDRIASIDEIGDGNLNLVFIVRDELGGSLVLKQALPYVRLVGPDWPMTPERARREAEATALHASLVPELLPVVHFFDDQRYVIAMEDLSDHRVWRGALNDGLRHDGVAEELGRYVGAVAFGTSVFGVDPEEHKRRVAAAINAEMCALTEDLVFTEPVVDAGRNSVLPGNAADAAELAADAYFVEQMGEAKWAFMTHAEALIHGDLHTGSVMVRAADKGADGRCSVKAFDTEFAFYGPVAFDLGALWANYTMAAARAVALGEQDRADWCLDLVAQTWRGFDDSFRDRWPLRVDPRVFTEPFLEHTMARWRSEAWLFASAKMARRVVGLAKVSDIETLDPGLREGAARGVLATAREAVRRRHADSAPDAYMEMARSLLNELSTRS